MTGLATPVEMSHKMCLPPKGKALCCRPEDCCKAEISGQPNCAAAMAAQSSAALAVARTTTTKEGEEDDTLFTSAAAEAGCEEGEGTVPEPTTRRAPLRQSPLRPALQEWM
jgi:hypothetical protein